MFYLGLDDIDIAKGHWSAWTKVTASSSPADRAMHTAVLYQNRMWIFGGIAGDHGLSRNLGPPGTHHWGLIEQTLPVRPTMSSFS